VFANLPFLSERLYLVWSFREGRKSVVWRLVELASYYALAAAVAFWMESRLGPVYRQRWEFYAITVCLFLVFAYPGFVYRYLRRRGA
jgi:Na+(H+)/acetate symporter ActP